MFTIVNVAVLVLRQDVVGHQHFRAPTALPVIGAVACAYLASPLSGRAAADYRIAAVLTAIGVVLWSLTTAVQRYVLHEDVEPDPARLDAPAP